MKGKRVGVNGKRQEYVEWRAQSRKFGPPRLPPKQSLVGEMRDLSPDLKLLGVRRSDIGTGSVQSGDFSPSFVAYCRRLAPVRT